MSNPKEQSSRDADANVRDERPTRSKATRVPASAANPVIPAKSRNVGLLRGLSSHFSGDHPPIAIPIHDCGRHRISVSARWTQNELRFIDVRGHAAAVNSAAYATCVYAYVALEVWPYNRSRLFFLIVGATPGYGGGANKNLGYRHTIMGIIGIFTFIIVVMLCIRYSPRKTSEHREYRQMNQGQRAEETPKAIQVIGAVLYATGFFHVMSIIGCTQAVMIYVLLLFEILGTRGVSE